MSDTEATQEQKVDAESPPVPKQDGRKTRTPKQMEALELARKKAMEMRKANAETTRKAKEIKKHLREEKRKEVERAYEEMISGKKEEPKEEPKEPDLVHEVKPKKSKKKPPPPPESEDDEYESEDDPQPVRTYSMSSYGGETPNKHAVKKQVTSNSIKQPQLIKQPPAYKHAFEAGLNMMLY